MSDFKNAVVFGLAIKNQFNELVIDPNTALRNLGLIPRDFFVLRNIGKTGETNPGIPNTFQKLSNLNQNLILKLDSLKSEVGQYDDVLDNLYEASRFRGFRGVRPIEGNLNVNGKLIAKSITQRVFDETTAQFKTVPITTSVNSAWDLTSTTITLGVPLKIASTSASPGKAGVRTGRLKNVQAFTPRRFLAEKATHKIAITIDGTQYFMYAIKNNPFSFDGDFRSISDVNLIITVSSGDINYVTSTFASSGVEVESGATSAADVNDLPDGTVLKVYTNPDNVTNLTITGHELENLPAGLKFTNASGIICNLSSNSFTTLPDIKKQFPNFKKINLSQPVTGSSIQMNFDFAELKSKMPNDITELRLKNSSTALIANTPASPATGNEFNLAPFDKLEILDLERTFGTTGNGPTPPLPVTIKTFNIFVNRYSILEEETLPDSNVIENLNLGRNTDLKVSSISPIHKYYLNGTYSNNLQTVNVQETKLGIPNLSGKTNLTSFTAFKMKYDNQKDTTGGLNSPSVDRFIDGRFQIVNESGTSKFQNCTSLKTINLRQADVAGPIPSFASNTSLVELDMSECDLINIDSPIADALVNLGLPNPNSLTSFKYIYNKADAALDSPPTENVLPAEAFQVTDVTSQTGFTPIALEEVVYKSNGITGGTFPLISATNLNIENNNFTSITPFSTLNAPRLTKLQAQGNKLTGEFNLQALFPGTAAYTVLEELKFENNDFTSFASSSIPTSKFSALKKLFLEKAFRNLEDSPPTLLTLPKFDNSVLQTIDVSNNVFHVIEDNVFSGCSSLTSFIIDETNKAKVSSMITSISLLQGVGTTSRDFSFSSGTNPKLNIQISNFTGRRSFTAEESDSFEINDKINDLSLKNVSVSGIIRDKDSNFPAPVPPLPTNLVLERKAPRGTSNKIEIKFDFIPNADRVIIKLITTDSPNEEFIGNGTLEGINVFNQDGTGTQTLSLTDTRLADGQADKVLRFEVFGENARSIITGVHNVRTISLSTTADSPPEFE